MSEKVMLIGGGGHAKVIMDIVHACGDTVVGLLDDGLEIGTVKSRLTRARLSLKKILLETGNFSPPPSSIPTEQTERK